MLTMHAVDKGAKLLPGRYWDLSGTFLFTVYAMTALGFGAPVPHTTWGRTSALIYALLAIPTHIYLMVNVSTCAAVSVDSCIRRLQAQRSNQNINEETIFSNRKVDVYYSAINDEPGMVEWSNQQVTSRFYRNNQVSYKMKDELSSLQLANLFSDSRIYNRNLKHIKNRNKCRRKLCYVVKVLSTGRFVPLASTLYYVIGMIAFGLLRNKSGTEIAMFPLQFTTSGGLAQVEFHVRVLYGFYVEGAMILLACTLATIRRYSSSTVTSLAQRFRLFNSEERK